jgi:hypothetical protein
MDLALNDDAVAAVFSVVAVHQKRQDSGNKEEDDVPRRR